MKTTRQHLTNSSRWCPVKKTSSVSLNCGLTTWATWFFERWEIWPCQSGRKVTIKKESSRSLSASHFMMRFGWFISSSSWLVLLGWWFLRFRGSFPDGPGPVQELFTPWEERDLVVTHNWGRNVLEKVAKMPCFGYVFCWLGTWLHVFCAFFATKHL